MCGAHSTVWLWRTVTCRNRSLSVLVSPAKLIAHALPCAHTQTGWFHQVQRKGDDTFRRVVVRPRTHAALVAAVQRKLAPPGSGLKVVSLVALPNTELGDDEDMAGLNSDAQIEVVLK